MNQFKTVKAENNFDRISVIEEKKSKFIGSAFYVQTETEVRELLNVTRKNNRGANHYCYAYRIVIDEQTLEKNSDDGEPTGTAGIQILNGIKAENLYNVLIIITRYFGGTLLGTGGLSKAYAEATKKTLKEVEYVYKTRGYEIEVEIEYKDLKNFAYFVKEIAGNIKEQTFLNNVKIKMEIPTENLEKITNNNNNTSFKIVKYDILNSKMIDIYSKTKIN